MLDINEREALIVRLCVGSVELLGFVSSIADLCQLEAF